MDTLLTFLKILVHRKGCQVLNKYNPLTYVFILLAAVGMGIVSVFEVLKGAYQELG